MALTLKQDIERYNRAQAARTIAAALDRNLPGITKAERKQRLLDLLNFLFS